MDEPKISFLGLGLMGNGMAARLLAAGYPLTVYNRTADKAAPLVQKGATLAASPAEAASGSTVIISMLADDHASRSVWLGTQGALAGAAPGTVLVEASTVTVGWIDELAAAAKGKGCLLLDAPVSGSKGAAAAGELVFFAGGEESALDKVYPLLKAMGRETIYLGPGGSGARMKLINNFLSGVQAASLAEALALVERSGLQPDKAAAVLTGGSPGSPMVKALTARMMARDYQPQFLLRLMAKDLTYAIEEGEHHALSLSTGAAALRVFEDAILTGQGEDDLSAVIEQFRRE